MLMPTPGSAGRHYFMQMRVISDSNPESHARPGPPEITPSVHRQDALWVLPALEAAQGRCAVGHRGRPQTRIVKQALRRDINRFNVDSWTINGV